MEANGFVARSTLVSRRCGGKMATYGAGFPLPTRRVAVYRTVLPFLLLLRLHLLLCRSRRCRSQGKPRQAQPAFRIPACPWFRSSPRMLPPLAPCLTARRAPRLPRKLLRRRRLLPHPRSLHLAVWSQRPQPSNPLKLSLRRVKEDFLARARRLLLAPPTIQRKLRPSPVVTLVRNFPARAPLLEVKGPSQVVRRRQARLPHQAERQRLEKELQDPGKGHLQLRAVGRNRRGRVEASGQGLLLVVA
mmetsp:Transcript_9519/g.21353  ORF Transcript_9519/g.21353 Transcript_9519/m.21353 type:complete len:246 (+) Transcript_9519:22-759(+)